MFSPVAWNEEVAPADLTFSRALPQYQSNDETVYRVNVTLRHPSFLVELPWLQLRFDVVPGKFSHFRLYLEPYGPVADAVTDFFHGLDQQLLARFPGAVLKPTVDESDGLPHVHVKIPSSPQLFSVFDASGAWLESPFPLPKGAYLQPVLDMSEVRLVAGGGTQKLCFVPRLFQCKVHTCPRSWCGARKAVAAPQGHPPPVPERRSPPAPARSKPVKFVPDLKQIVNVKKSLRKVA